MTNFTGRDRGRVKLIGVKATGLLRVGLRVRRLPQAVCQELRLGPMVELVLALLALDERLVQRGSLTVSPMISMQSGQTNSVHRLQHGTLELEVFLRAGEEQLVDAVLRHGRRRNGDHVLLDLPRQPLQGQPNGLGVHFVHFVQDQLRDRNGLQVRVAAAAADVQDVGARGLQAHGVGVNEQLT